MKMEKSFSGWNVPCVNKYDTSCLKIAKTHHNSLNRDDVLWVCPNCLPVLNKFKKDDHGKLKDLMQCPDVAQGIDKIKTSTSNILKQQESMEKTMTAIEVQLNSSLGNLDVKLKKEIEDLKTTVKSDMPKMWSDVVKTTNISNLVPSTVDMVDQVKRAIYEVAESDKEQELRSRGIVVYKLPEKEDETKENRSAEDKETMEELLNHIGCSEAEIIYAERLGRFNADRCKERKFRPIKVRFSRKESRDMVLKNLYKLRSASDNIKFLSIRQDLNDRQREELRKMTDEAYQKSRASTTMHYRVKGEPGNYRLIEVPKKFPTAGN
jgi:hypothetical protein